MNKLKNTVRTSLIALVSVAIVAGVTHAGSLTPSNTPPTTNFYTLSDVYDKLVTNTSAGNHAISTTTSPASSFRTIAEIYDAIPATFAMSDTSEVIPVGINRAATTLSTVDPDFVAANIKEGVVIFGITGTAIVSTTSITWQVDPNKAPCWSAGVYEIGAGCTTGNGGFIDNGGTNLGAVEYCQYLNSDGVTLASTIQNVWRLPTIAELFNASAVGNNPVGGFTHLYYWSSVEDSVSYAKAVTISSGASTSVNKFNYWNVRCVK